MYFVRDECMACGLHPHAPNLLSRYRDYMIKYASLDTFSLLCARSHASTTHCRTGLLKYKTKHTVKYKFTAISLKK